MMRPMTCLSLIAALGSGLYLYQEKHSAQMLDRDITRTVKQTDQARERIGLLKAEWALLNEPERLQGLAGSHLQLQSLAPAQFARLEDLPSRLPALSSAQVNASPVVDMAQAQPPAAAGCRADNCPPAGSAQPASRAPSLIAQPLNAQPLIAQNGPTASFPRPAAPVPAAKPVLVATTPAPAPKPATARARTQDAEPAVPSTTAPRPLYAPVMPAYSPAPVLIHAPTIQTASAMASPQPPGYVGSALGMARTMLAAPVPIASPSFGSAMGFAAVR